MYLRCVVRQKISDITYFFQVVLARIVAGGEKIPVVSAACQVTGEGKRENLVLTERMPVKEGNVMGSLCQFCGIVVVVVQ